MKPKLHFTAPRNWINDPNGLIYYKGEYHVFYQHFPYEPFWGTMHWGHAVTKDFIHFKDLPIALYPSKTYDRNGCFSGSAIELDGKMYLYYTAIQYLESQDDYIHIQKNNDDILATQALMISEDGYHFDNRKDKHLIIDTIKDETLGNDRHTRDPKVWKTEDNKICMILGSKMKKDDRYYGEVLFYESEDGIDFHYKNRFIDESIGDMWECPDIFKINGHWFMIFSPEHIRKEQPQNNAVYMPVSFDEKNFQVKRKGDYIFIDQGLDFYAPQTFLDENHQRIMIGWLRMRETVKGEEWIGMLTMPRVLTVKDDQLYQDVLPQIKQLFVKSVDKIDFNQPFVMKVTMNENSHIDLGGFQLYIQDDQLYVNRESVSICNDEVNNISHTPKLNGRYDLEIYYDHHVFEIFINEGYYVLSQVVYDLKDDHVIDNVNSLNIKVID